MPVLDAVIDQATMLPPELPRLTVADSFITYQRMVTALQNSMEEASKLPTGSREAVNEALKAVIKYSDSAIKNANRLLEANK